MRPDPPKVLMGIASSLFMNVMPETRTPFGQTIAGMAGSLAFAIALEFDRLADRLNSENGIVAALLSDARSLVQVGLADQIAAVAALRPADIKVSTLQELNDRLRAVLTDVHAAIEAQNSPEAKAMDARIWAELIESTRRRHIEMPR